MPDPERTRFARPEKGRIARSSVGSCVGKAKALVERGKEETVGWGKEDGVLRSLGL